jgi:colicin import membrane protein
MATDKALPGILGTAQNRTGHVARALAAQSRGVAALGGSTPGWTSPAAKKFQKECAAAARQLAAQARTIEALEGTLGAAKKAAELRIHQEWLAEQAAAKRAAEQAAAAKRAAEQADKGK